jgi:hypothetical protein
MIDFQFFGQLLLPALVLDLLDLSAILAAGMLANEMRDMIRRALCNVTGQGELADKRTALNLSAGIHVGNVFD